MKKFKLKKTSKIRNKIIILLVSISTLNVTVIGGISIYKSKKITEDQSKLYMETLSKNKKQELESKFEEVEHSINSIKNNIESSLDIKNIKNKQYTDNYLKNLQKIIKTQGENTPWKMSIYLDFDPKITQSVAEISYVTENDKLTLEEIKTDINKFKEDNKDMEWFYSTLKSDKSYWTNPYFEAEVDKDVISYLCPINIAGTNIGVIGIDIDFKDFENIVKTAKAYNNGNSYLLNKDLNFIVHNKFKANDNLAKVYGKSLEEEVQDIKNKKSGIFEYKFENKNYISSYARLSNGYIFITEVENKEIFKESRQLLIIIIVISILAIVISILEALYYGNKISKPIEKLTSYIKVLANLDLREKCLQEHVVTSNDEIGNMARELKKLGIELNEIIKGMRGDSSTTKQSSLEVVKVMEESSAALNEISNTVSQLTTGATEQAEVTQSGVKSLEELSKSLEFILMNTSEIQEHSKEIKKVNGNSQEYLSELTYKFKDNEKMFDTLKNNIQSLLESSRFIKDMVIAIDDIAKKTKLLSLNASIEAARAGEGGKGFRVVAEEIKKLSEQTEESANNINNIIIKIEENMTNTKVSMGQGKDSMEETGEALVEVKDSFKSIEQVEQSTIDKIEELLKKVEDINELKESVVYNMENISSITEEFSASMEELLATTEEQNSSIECVVNSCKQLEDVSISLDNKVSKFKIE